MQNKPRALLRDFQVLGERHGRDAFRMVRDHPNGHEPLAQRQFRVGEDRPNLDRKTRAAAAALERLAVAEMINAVAVAVRAKLAVAPADRAQMVDASLFVWEGVHQVKEAVKVRNHSASPFDEDTLAQFSDWVKHVYSSPNNHTAQALEPTRVKGIPSSRKINHLESSIESAEIARFAPQKRGLVKKWFCHDKVDGRHS